MSPIGKMLFDMTNDLNRVYAAGMKAEEKPLPTDQIKKIDLALQILISAWEDTRATEIADAMDMLSDWREQYVRDNSQFGVGA